MQGKTSSSEIHCHFYIAMFEPSCQILKSSSVCQARPILESVQQGSHLPSYREKSIKTASISGQDELVDYQYHLKLQSMCQSKTTPHIPYFPTPSRIQIHKRSHMTAK